MKETVNSVFSVNSRLFLQGYMASGTSTHMHNWSIRKSLLGLPIHMYICVHMIIAEQEARHPNRVASSLAYLSSNYVSMSVMLQECNYALSYVSISCLSKWLPTILSCVLLL